MMLLSNAHNDSTAGSGLGHAASALLELYKDPCLCMRVSTVSLQAHFSYRVIVGLPCACVALNA